VPVPPGSEAKKWVITDAVHHNFGKVEEEVEWDVMGEAEKRSQNVKAVKPLVLLRLIEQLDMEQVLVFCRTNLDCDNLEKFFIAAGGGNKFSGKKEGGKQGVYSCCVLAGMRSQQERKQNLEAFKDGDVRILIATDVAARGIDISGLPYVVNMTLPEQSENYIHRVGRVGRAEKMGLAISIVAASYKEKVWWCQNKKKPPQFDRRLFEEGGNCKWQDEGRAMHEVEKRLGGLKVTQIKVSDSTQRRRESPKGRDARRSSKCLTPTIYRHITTATGPGTPQGGQGHDQGGRVRGDAGEGRFQPGIRAPPGRTER